MKKTRMYNMISLVFVVLSIVVAVWVISRLLSPAVV